jgi:hypothetical protein
MCDRFKTPFSPQEIRKELKEKPEQATAVVGDIVTPHDPTTEIEVKTDAPKG